MTVAADLARALTLAALAPGLRAVLVFDAAPDLLRDLAAAWGKHRDGFEDVGLARAISPVEANEARPRREVQRGVIAKVGQGQPGKHQAGDSAFAGDPRRAQLIAQALAHAFPEKGETEGGSKHCVVS